MEKRPIDKLRHWLPHDEEPTLPYVVLMPDGKLGEAASPFYLCDLIFHPNFTDCDNPSNWFILMLTRLREIALTHFTLNGIRVSIYDSLGLFYDNLLGYTDHSDELEYENRENPVVIDAYSPFTAITSLVKAGYIQVWEKIPTFAEQTKKKGCGNCIFNKKINGNDYCGAWDYIDAQFDWEIPCWWITNGDQTENYQYVKPEEITGDYSYQKGWKPVELRTNEYLGLRKLDLIKFVNSKKED
jgi:hypothetical protein